MIMQACCNAAHARHGTHTCTPSNATQDDLKHSYLTVLKPATELRPKQICYAMPNNVDENASYMCLVKVSECAANYPTTSKPCNIQRYQAYGRWPQSYVTDATTPARRVV
jgi:hypothetical protein